LDCSNNQLTQLSILPASIISLEVKNNPFENEIYTKQPGIFGVINIRKWQINHYNQMYEEEIIKQLHDNANNDAQINMIVRSILDKTLDRIDYIITSLTKKTTYQNVYGEIKVSDSIIEPCCNNAQKEYILAMIFDYKRTHEDANYVHIVPAVAYYYYVVHILETHDEDMLRLNDISTNPNVHKIAQNLIRGESASHVRRRAMGFNPVDDWIEPAVVYDKETTRFRNIMGEMRDKIDHKIEFHDTLGKIKKTLKNKITSKLIGGTRCRRRNRYKKTRRN
jgi:hypothetical protein